MILQCCHLFAFFVFLQLELDLEALNKFKELYGIDLTDLDFDDVQARPRLDSTVQKSKVVAVQQDKTQRRLPTKVADRLGTLYPQHRKTLKMMSVPNEEGASPNSHYASQKSAPEAVQRVPEEDVSAHTITIPLVHYIRKAMYHF